MPSRSLVASTQARRREGLEVSLGHLGQDQLVKRQIRNRLAEAGAFNLQLLETLHLVKLHAALLIAPAILRHFSHPIERIGSVIEVP